MESSTYLLETTQISLYREVVDEDLLADVLVGEPELPVRPQEEVDGRVPRQRVQRRLAEAGDDGALPLHGHHLGRRGLVVDRRVVDHVQPVEDLAHGDDAPDEEVEGLGLHLAADGRVLVAERGVEVVLPVERVRGVQLVGQGQLQAHELGDGLVLHFLQEGRRLRKRGKDLARYHAARCFPYVCMKTTTSWK